MVDVISCNSWLGCTLRVLHLIQMVVQGTYVPRNPLMVLPHVTHSTIVALTKSLYNSGFIPALDQMSLIDLKERRNKRAQAFDDTLIKIYNSKQVADITNYLNNLPVLDVRISVPETGMNKEGVVVTRGMEQLVLEPETDYDFVFNMRRIGESRTHAIAPKFLKQKEESWILCIGDSASDTLIKIKRFSIGRTAKFSLLISTPPTTGIVWLFRNVYVIKQLKFSLEEPHNNVMGPN